MSGKYKRADTSNTGRLSGANPFGNSEFVERNWKILDALNTVAEQIERPAAPVALAWVMARPGITSTLIGARTVLQLESNIAATSIRLRDDQMTLLSDASALTPGFSASLGQPLIRRMVFGGQDVVGWNEL